MRSVVRMRTMIMPKRVREGIALCGPGIFKMRLKRDKTLFHDAVLFETSNGTISFDPSHVYVGGLEVYPLERESFKSDKDRKETVNLPKRIFWLSQSLVPISLRNIKFYRVA
ncbi:hypothetical protein KQX54_014021 [Cotesia glomerata]|uniref:Uncharacterized protein n=1 Tax=Cotesia glomerata TaxID=32391 RepID=A0AAV7I8C8_COTGL|nr:hypothetical protein KQX54_014021 [Cotesia glomerata]